MVIQDSFYHPLTDEQLKKVHEYNFDHPGSYIQNLMFIGLSAFGYHLSYLFGNEAFLTSFILHYFLLDAFDVELLLSCTETLKSGKAVSIPNYDYKRHKNVETSRTVVACTH